MLGGLRFGLQDESERLNINILAVLADPAAAAATAAAAAQTSGSSTGTAAATGGTSTSGTPTTGGATGPTTGGSTGSTAPTTGATTGSNTSTGAASTGNGTGTSSTSNYESLANGITDASGEAILMDLPGMTIEVAHAILDWLDTDDTPREYGAEVEYYSSLMPPYAPANGPLKTLEELLLVRGVTPDLLFGRDVNRNGMLDIQEQSLPLNVIADDGTGSMDLGWAAYLSLYSKEKNVASDGTARINVNESDLQTLYDNLSAVCDASWVTFIVAYRQSGPYDANNAKNAASGNASGTAGDTSGAAGGAGTPANEEPAGS